MVIRFAPTAPCGVISERNKVGWRGDTHKSARSERHLEVRRPRSWGRIRMHRKGRRVLWEPGKPDMSADPRVNEGTSVRRVPLRQSLRKARRVPGDRRKGLVGVHFPLHDEERWVVRGILPHAGKIEYRRDAERTESGVGTDP